MTALKLKIFYLLIGIFFVSNSIAQTSKYYVRSYGGNADDEGIAICNDANNNTYATGYFSGTMMIDSFTYVNGSGVTDIYIIKNDVDGNLLWVKKAGGGGVDKPTGISCDNAGNFYLTGFFSGTALFGTISVTSHGLQDCFVAKYDNTGQPIWVRTGGGNYNDQGNSVAFDSNGNVIITGQFSGTATFGSQSIISNNDPLSGIPTLDVFIAKYNSQGTLLWIKKGSSDFTDRGLGVSVDNSGNIYVTGQFSDTVTFSNTYNNTIYNAIFLLKLDASGNDVWFKKIGGGITNTAYAVANDVNGDILLSGYFKGNTIVFGPPNVTLSNTYDSRVFLIRFDPAGNLIWWKAFGSACEADVRDIALDDSSNIFLTGSFKCKLNSFSDIYGQGTFNTVGYHDIYVAKYKSNGDFDWARNYGSQLEDAGRGITVDHLYQPVITGSFEDRMMYPASHDSSFNFLYNNYWYYWCIYSAYNPYICHDDSAMFFYPLITKGGKDVYISKSCKPTLLPYYYYFNYFDSLCIRPYVPVEISNGTTVFQDCSPNNTSSTICDDAYLIANSNTSTIYDISLQNICSPGPRFHYLWSTGDTDRVIDVTQSGMYWVKMTSFDSCFVSYDTLQLIVHQSPPTPLISDSKGVNTNALNAQTVNICKPDSVTFTATINSSYDIIWTTPTNFTDTASSIKLTYANNYYTNPNDDQPVYICYYLDSNHCEGWNYAYLNLDSALRLIVPKLNLFDYFNNNPLNSDTVKICLPTSHQDFYLTVFDSLIDPLGIHWVCDPPYYIKYSTFNWTVSPSIPHYGNGCNQNQYFSPVLPGWYHITCTFVRNSPCGGVDSFLLAKDVYVVINQDPIVNATITGGDILCFGDTILLNGSGGQYFSWYYSVDGDDPFSTFITTQQSIIVNTPGVYTVMVSDTTSFGCFSGNYVSQTVTFPIPPLITMIPTDGLICPNDSVQLHVFGNGVYNWSGPLGPFGGNNTIVYATTPGDYYCVVDSGGCSVVSNSVEVIQYSTPFIDVTPSYVICPGASVQLSVVANDNSIIQWLPPLSGNSPTQNITQPGTYACSVTCCNIVTIDSVTVYASLVAANINPPGPVNMCIGDSVLLSASSGMSYYEWSPVTSNDPQITVSQPGSYSVVTTDLYGCTAQSIPVIVNFLPVPDAPVITSNSPVCSGDSLYINASIVPGFNFSWTGPNNFYSTDSTILFYPAFYSFSGMYEANLSNSVCNAKSTIAIQVDTISEVNIQLTGTNCLLEPLSLTHDTLSDAAFLWTTPSNGTSTESEIQIEALAISDTGWYYLQTQKGACSVSDSIEVSAIDCELLIPNIFTPNDDGINDFFEIRNFYGDVNICTIYNRWGQKVYEWNSVNGKWDGNDMHSGSACPAGTYYYILQLQTGNKVDKYNGLVELIK